MGKALLVARREYLAYVTAWGFWLGLLFTPLILGLAMGLPQLIEKTQPARYYTVLDASGEFADALSRELSRQRDMAAADVLTPPDGVSGNAQQALDTYKRLRSEGVNADDALKQVSPGASALPPQSFVYVSPPGNTLDALIPFLTGEQEIAGPLGDRALYAAFVVYEDRIEYWSDDVVTTDLSTIAMQVSAQLALNQTLIEANVDDSIFQKAKDAALPVDVRSPSAANETGEISFSDRAPFFIALAFSFMLWLLIFSVVNYLLTGTIEERSNKIFDALLTSVSLAQLMTGKLLGVLGLSLTLIGVWSSASALFALLAQNSIPPDVAMGLSQITSPQLLIPTLISFVLGYVMYGALFLALGSLCDTIQEAQSLLSPIFIVMMIPLLMLPVAISNPGSPLLSGLSWVPLLTPFLLILRIPGEPPMWQLVLQILWMAFFSFGMLWAGTRVYRAGAVNGAGLSDARRWIGGLFGRRPKEG